MMRKNVLDRYADIRGGLPGELRSRWDAVVDNAGSALKPFTRDDRVVIHSDPNPDNILFGENTCLVDWEHARFDIPEWDIAMFLNKYEFMYEVEQQVLESFVAAYEPGVHHLDLVRLFAYLSIMNWLIERLETVESIPSEVFASSTEEVLNMLRDDLSTAHTLLKRV
jgi:thiamine kinase-like enzyme